MIIKIDKIYLIRWFRSQLGPEWTKKKVTQYSIASFGVSDTSDDYVYEREQRYKTQPNPPGYNATPSWVGRQKAKKNAVFVPLLYLTLSLFLSAKTFVHRQPTNSNNKSFILSIVTYKKKWVVSPAKTLTPRPVGPRAGDPRASLLCAIPN